MPLGIDQREAEHDLLYRVGADDNERFRGNRSDGPAFIGVDCIGDLDDASGQRRVATDDMCHFGERYIFTLTQIHHGQRHAFGRGQVARGFKLCKIKQVVHAYLILFSTADNFTYFDKGYT